MANAAKARKRLAGPAPDREPKMQLAYRYEFRVRDRFNGDTSDWIVVRSGRDASRRLAALLKFLP